MVSSIILIYPSISRSASVFQMATLRCLHPAIRAILPVRCVSNLISVSGFHHSAALDIRTRSTRDKSKSRGVSAIHRKYPKDPLSVSKVPLPQPVAPEEERPVIVDSDHGLYGFFAEGEGTEGAIVLPTPENDHKHGTTS